MGACSGKTSHKVEVKTVFQEPEISQTQPQTQNVPLAQPQTVSFVPQYRPVQYVNSGQQFSQVPFMKQQPQGSFIRAPVQYSGIPQQYVVQQPLIIGQPQPYQTAQQFLNVQQPLQSEI